MFASCQYKYSTYYICMPICVRHSYYGHICTYMAVQFYIIVHWLTYKSTHTLAHVYAHIAFHLRLIGLHFCIWPPKLHLNFLRKRRQIF